MLKTWFDMSTFVVQIHDVLTHPDGLALPTDLVRAFGVDPHHVIDFGASIVGAMIGQSSPPPKPAVTTSASDSDSAERIL